MQNQLRALERSGLTAAALRRLGRARIRLRVVLRSFEVTRSVAALPPDDRHPFLRRRAVRWARRLMERHPQTQWRTREGPHEIPMWIEGSVSAAAVPVIAAAPGVDWVVVGGAPGRRARKAVRRATWFCVRARVAVQVEGAERGMQTVEDRFMLVRAASAEQAERRLLPHWREYALPYLNSDGQLVRWKFEGVTDVYEVVSDDGDSLDMAEVYSRLGGRRMRPELVWTGSDRKGIRNSGSGGRSRGRSAR